ncbi:methyl-accepting chemotaxis protein [Shewanella profunda]|uniref:methyl-accepting chemotaxis protein n=1 Tax=Shewanella profunda TaxID=254793 RepID=UPI00200F8197|nr:methyl-accepting chemotaxis protein [Shewanella profunda]MCL1088546.1 methyl-accepting chemotaxis protein [Shewanella profunda]
MLNKMTLKTQFIGVIAIPCIALILICLTAIQGLFGMQTQTKKLAENTITPLRSMAEVASRIPRMRVGIDIIILQEIPTMKDKKGVLTRVNETRTEDIPEMDAALKSARDAQVNPNTRDEVQKLIDLFEKVKNDELAPMLSAMENGDVEKSQEIYRNQFAASYSIMRKSTDSILDTLLQQGNASFVESQQNYQVTRIEMFAVLAIGLSISLLLGFIMLRRLRLRVALLQQHISSASDQLDLHNMLGLKGQDELSDIALHFNQFVVKIRSVIEAVADNSRQLAHTANDVAGKAQATLKNCINERDRTTQIATAIHEMGTTVENIADNATQAANAAKEADNQAHNGASVVAKARQSVSTLSIEIQHISTDIASLATQTNSIGSILDTIRSISEQTNLLALNAAIEAARAGETGRGFAVVADEVRNLASRSASSTNEIQIMIDKLQEQSSKTVTAIKRGHEQSDMVVKQADDANDSLALITSHISQISDMNIQVATATEEQSMVVTEISRNVEDINQLTTETSEIADELTASSANLQKLSVHLDKLVTQFKL